MVLFSIVGIIVVVILFLFLGRILSVVAKVVFYLLLFTFITMLIFNISFAQMWNGLLNVVTWAF